MEMDEWLGSFCYDSDGGRFVVDEEVSGNDGGSRGMEIDFFVARREKVIADDDTVKATWSMMKILSVGVRRGSSVACSSDLRLQAFCFVDRI